jgi:predicted aconitase with swiveling domain
VSWLLALLTGATITGYVAIYVSLNGKFCGAQLSAETERLITAWAMVASLTVVVMVVSACLRRHAKRSVSESVE